MDERQQKGLVIAATMPIKRNGDTFVVPSQSYNGKYRVDATAKSCSCPDYELRQTACKHVYAVEFFCQRETNIRPDGTTTVVETQAVRVTYAQPWAAYNAAQTSEKSHFLRLLKDLCASVPREMQGNGRPRMQDGDRVFCAAFKVYSGMSARRFSTDLRTAHADGFIPEAPCYNSVLNFMDEAELTPILHELITRSSLPLAAVETQFAVDSTGFGTSRFFRYYNQKYGHEQINRDWVKCHAMVGTKTNVVTAVKITDRDAYDGPQLPELVKHTAQNFWMSEVSADKAYLSRNNLETITDLGSAPYIPFKINSVGNSDSPLWNKLYHFFNFKRDEFLPHYHRRSNVETTFSMVKRIFGDSVRAKTAVAQGNEVLLMILCHNIRCLIHEMHELGISPQFAV